MSTRVALTDKRVIRTGRGCSWARASARKPESKYPFKKVQKSCNPNLAGAGRILLIRAPLGNISRPSLVRPLEAGHIDVVNFASEHHRAGIRKTRGIFQKWGVLSLRMLSRQIRATLDSVRIRKSYWNHVSLSLSLSVCASVSTPFYVFCTLYSSFAGECWRFMKLLNVLSCSLDESTRKSSGWLSGMRSTALCRRNSQFVMQLWLSSDCTELTNVKAYIFVRFCVFFSQDELMWKK